MTEVVSIQTLRALAQRARKPKLLKFPIEKWGLFLMAFSTLVWASSLGIGFLGSLAILSFVGFAASLVGLRVPALGVLGIGMLCTLDTIMRNFLATESGYLRWNTLNYLLTLVIVLNAIRLASLDYLPLRMLIVFSAFLLLGVVYSGRPLQGIQHWLNITCAFAIFVYFLKAAPDPRIWMWLGLVDGTISAVGGLFFNIFQDRLGYILMNAYVYFPLMGLFSICLAYRFTPRRFLPQITLQALAIINAIWVFLSGSRGGMTLALCCLVFLLLSMRNISHRIMVVGMGFLLSAILLVQFKGLQETALGRVEKLFSSERSLANRTSGRSDLVEAAWNIFLENPLVGVGTGGFSVVYAKKSLRMDLRYSKGSEADAHAGWMKVLAENGIIGFLLFAGFIGSFALVGYYKRKTGAWPIGLLASTTLAMAFISTGFQAKGVWFIPMGALVQMYCVYGQQSLHPGRLLARARALTHSRPEPGSGGPPRG